MALDDLLVDTVRVISIANSQDVAGGNVRTPVPGPVIYCNVQCNPGSRADNNDRIGSATTCNVYFSSDPGFGTTDQLQWLTGGDGTSKADAGGAFPIITLDSPAINQASRGVFKVTGFIRPIR